MRAQTVVSRSTPKANSRSSVVWLLLWSLAALIASCAGTTSEQSDPTGGETHFLTRCTEGETCGGGLSCICGACSLPCDSRRACEALPGAVCLETRTATCAAAAPRCDAPCVVDEDCAAISARHRCDAGACRADSEMSGAAGAPSASTCSLREVPANQVLLLGDSFFALRHEITAFLEDQARTLGILGAGERYRDGSSLLDNALAFMGNGIARQYEKAKSDAPAQIVIMDGGGADVLAASCDAGDCPALDAAAAGARDLLAQLAEDDVREVVYVFYPNTVDEGLRSKVDVLRPLIENACQESAVTCHWLDLRPIFEGRLDELIEDDDLNPTAAGSQATAAAIVSALGCTP